MTAQAKLKELFNSDEYSPLEHVFMFIVLNGTWLEWCEDAILDSDIINTSGEMQKMGEHMKFMNEVQEILSEETIADVKLVDLAREWKNDQNTVSDGLTDKVSNLVNKELGGLGPSVLRMYIESKPMQKIWEMLDIELTVVEC